jgi:hypothetical protein
MERASLGAALGSELGTALHSEMSVRPSLCHPPSEVGDRLGIELESCWVKHWAQH